jgi:rubrerythrin
MAYIKIEITTLDDHGHYGTTSYYCSECGHNCNGQKIKCPKCGIEFNEEPKTKLNGYPFGGSDF